jgi:Fis family transcriptional regulator
MCALSRLRSIVDTRSSHSVPTTQAESPRTGIPTLGECMASSARRYLADLNGTPCREGLYACLLREVEAPMLREVLAWSDGNQSRAAEVLGIHRATLRKKLRELGIV